MKLYYKYDKYNCTIKSELGKFIRKNEFANFHPVKIKFTIPLFDYNNMVDDIIECGNEFHFKLLVNKGDKHDLSEIEDGLWVVDSRVDRTTITSRLKNGIVIVIFEIKIFQLDKSSISEMRDLIISDLFS